MSFRRVCGCSSEPGQGSLFLLTWAGAVRVTPPLTLHVTCSGPGGFARVSGKGRLGGVRRTCLASRSSSRVLCGRRLHGSDGPERCFSANLPCAPRSPCRPCRELGGRPWLSSRPSSPCVPLPPAWIPAMTPGHVRPCLHLLALLRRASPQAGV